MAALAWLVLLLSCQDKVVRPCLFSLPHVLTSGSPACCGLIAGCAASHLPGVRNAQPHFTWHWRGDETSESFSLTVWLLVHGCDAEPLGCLSQQGTCAAGAGAAGNF